MSDDFNEQIIRKLIEEISSSKQPSTSKDVLDKLSDIHYKQGIDITPDELVGQKLLEERKIDPKNKYKINELFEDLSSDMSKKPSLEFLKPESFVKKYGEGAVGYAFPEDNLIAIKNKSPFEDAYTLKHELEHIKDYQKNPKLFDKTKEMSDMSSFIKRKDISSDILGEYDPRFKGQTSDEIIESLKNIDPKEATKIRQSALEKLANNYNLGTLLKESGHFIENRMPLMEELRRIAKLVPKAGRKLLGPAGIGLGVASAIDSSQAGDYPQAIADIEPTGLAQLGLWTKDLIEKQAEEESKEPYRKWNVLESKGKKPF